MRIIIVGVGKIGSTITNFLAKENHDITVIDTNHSLVQNIIDIYDVKGIIGNGASYEVLVDANAQKADLLIATTASDELNILSCLISKKMGTKYTISRVRNPEYSNQLDFIHKELGINLIVNPELETANEIFQLLRFPSALKIESFTSGQVEIAEMNVEENSPLIGKTLSQIRKELEINFLISIVERKQKAYIPDGNFILKPNDKIYVNAANYEIINFFKKVGNIINKVKTVMIIGGSKISYYLAKQLIHKGIKVKIIEKDKQRCGHLCNLLPEVDIVHGEGSDQTLLIEEGIEKVDSLVTLTGFDEDNIIISLFAKTIEVPKIITKVNRYNLSNILQKLNLESIITPKEVTANQIIRFVRSIDNTLESEVKTLYKLVNNQVEAMEFYISESTKYTGIQIKDLKIKPNTLISCIIRDNKVIIPSGLDTLEPKDSVIIVTTNKYIYNLEDIFQ